MDQQEHHQMVLETTHSSGAEEWYCPTCGRRFLMQWPPTYKKIVLETGDEYAIHSGNKGGLFIGCEITPAETMPAAETSHDDIGSAVDTDADDAEDTPLTEELRPWLRWLNESSLNDGLDDTDQ
jgi:hypothetical protein